MPELTQNPARLISTPDEIGRSAQRKVSLRLIPVIAAGYALAFVDRANISFASLQMNIDLHFSASVYGLGAGLFFVGYALCEIPSNMLLLRFGARRWLARIMFSWGIIAASMMFVRTPWQFYLMRFLLGVAEAGFLPGVLYYLTLWFPSQMRARAVSRFYIAPPLSSVLIGSLAGFLLGLNGKLGLAGWQWLFLAEGLPSVAFSFVILRALPERPSDASWLTADEKDWLEGRLRADALDAHIGHKARAVDALASPKVWMIGAFFFCAQLAMNAYTFSAPAILQEATQWSVTKVGFLIAGLGLAGAAAMLLNGMHSDRSGERTLHSIVPCLVMCAGFIGAGCLRAPWAVVAGLALSFIAYNALQAPALALPMQFLAGRAAAAGIAGMNTITMLSGFVGPYWMGLMRDATGSNQAGLRGLAIPCLVCVALMGLLARSLRKSAPQKLA
jgi:ACS family tartrate transporter-like MFS transporter